jgi:hypothetical protein
MGEPAAMLPRRGKLGGALFVREFLLADDFQRASLVLVAAQDALFFQCPDVLEDGHLACAELVGQLLHGRGIAMQVTVVSDRDDHIQLTRREVHDLLQVRLRHPATR